MNGEWNWSRFIKNKNRFKLLEKKKSKLLWIMSYRLIQRLTNYNNKNEQNYPSCPDRYYRLR